MGEYLKADNELETRRMRNNQFELLKLVEDELMKIILDRAVKHDLLDELSRNITLRIIDPYTAKDKMMELIGNK